MTSEPSAVLDLSDTLPLLTHTLHLLRPGTQQKVGWAIELAGPAHEKTVAISALFAREAIEKEKAIEFAQVNGRKWKVDEEDEVVRRRRNVGRVCARMIGWSPDPLFRFFQDGPVAFSEKTATELFLRPEMSRFFLQVTDYLNGEAAFMPPSGTT